MIWWFRYVVHAEVQSYLDKGWTVSCDLQDVCHGHHAVLMVREGQDEPT